MAGAHPTVIKHRLGWLEIARSSSLLLDDLEALSLDVQRLLEAVESGRFWRVGGEFAGSSRCPIFRRRASGVAPHAVGIGRSALRRMAWLVHYRLAAAARTHRRSAIADRGNTAPIQARRGRAQEPRSVRLSGACDHHWPGNLRELISVLERAVLACPDGMIMEDHLPPLDSRSGRGSGPFGSEKEWDSPRPAAQPLSAQHDRRLSRHLTQDALQQDARYGLHPRRSERTKGRTHRALAGYLSIADRRGGPAHPEAKKTIAGNQTLAWRAQPRALTAFSSARMPSAKVLRPTCSLMRASSAADTSNSANHSTNVLSPSVIGLTPKVAR